MVERLREKNGAGVSNQVATLSALTPNVRILGFRTKKDQRYSYRNTWSQCR